jgi:DNA-binding HxlR family transcriptional regulator
MTKKFTPPNVNFWKNDHKTRANLAKNSKEIQFLKRPDLFARITEKELDKKIVQEIDPRKTIFLCSCGALVENHQIASYNLLVSGYSGVGKDYVTSHTLEIWPKEMRVKRTRVSPTALTYWHNAKFEPEWTWNGKTLYLEDISNGVLNHEVLKVMASSGSLATVTIHNRAYDIEVKGKPVLFLTSASATPSPEIVRRFVILQLDETVDQTVEILKRQAKFAKEGKNPGYSNEVTDALRYLERVKVKVPFSLKLTRLFPPQNIIMRTHFQRFLDYIKASAALHQYQRRFDSQGFIVAERADFDIARLALLRTMSNPLMIPLTRDQRKIIGVFKGLEAGAYSVSDLERLITFVSHKTIYSHLNKLANYGILRKDSERREEASKPVMVFSLTNLHQITIPKYSELDTFIASEPNVVNIPNIPSLPNVTKPQKQPQLYSYIDHTKRATFGKFASKAIMRAISEAFSIAGSLKYFELECKVLELLKVKEEEQKNSVGIQINGMIEEMRDKGEIFEPRPGELELVK